jgi:hypothetical protein
MSQWRRVGPPGNHPGELYPIVVVGVDVKDFAHGGAPGKLMRHKR